MSEQDTHDQPKKSKVRVKAWHIVLLALAVVTTFALAWWQWTRFQSGTGTFQNLGYAFQWPLFGAFFVYAYRKGIQYENEARQAHNEADDPDFLYEADSRKFGGQAVTEIDTDFLPKRPTMDVDTFNSLNSPERERERRRR